ncbi:helix-turn-helix transcriptional regulator [Ohtaekwangia kribbensis]|jgi:DNA-binding NarL/FixJ family response regulator|uniref:Helix-turn-helix transcriptional regulator n=1 Tax=Ohtaekwangia kribbensis TaxID=688913 RepID=A0ABW3K055_9BACT
MIKEFKINSEKDIACRLQSCTACNDLQSVIAFLEQCNEQYRVAIDIVDAKTGKVPSQEENHLRKLLDQLTKRECEVLYLAFQRLQNKEISEKLCISLETVKSHRKNIVSKAGVRCLNDLKDIFFNITELENFDILKNHSWG